MKKRTKEQRRRLLIIIAAVVVILAVSVGTTLALLIDTTDPVVNTFTVGNIDITLTETADPDTFVMVPGNTIAKDPKVTVEGGSEACYLFVQITPANNTGSSSSESFIEYGVRSGWTQGDGTNIPSNVWYRTVAASDTDQEFYVLTQGTGATANGYVTVNEDITKEDLDAVTSSTQPTLTFTAYAVQQANVASAAEAWAAATA